MCLLLREGHGPLRDTWPRVQVLRLQQQGVQSRDGPLRALRVLQGHGQDAQPTADVQHLQGSRGDHGQGAHDDLPAMSGNGAPAGHWTQSGLHPLWRAGESGPATGRNPAGRPGGAACSSSAAIATATPSYPACALPPSCCPADGICGRPDRDPHHQLPRRTANGRAGLLRPLVQ